MEIYHDLTPTLPLRSCHHSGTPWKFHEGHIETLILQEADYLGFGFGEVDCRTAIHKQVEEYDRDYEEVIVHLSKTPGCLNFLSKSSRVVIEQSIVSNDQ